MSWEIEYTNKAIEDLAKLDASIRVRVYKALERVAQNPVSKFDGGYGNPLGHKHGVDLSGLYKIKFKSVGIRVVYGLKKVEKRMIIIVISAREDDEVYIEAGKRR